jgi:hypothetical protein
MEDEQCFPLLEKFEICAFEEKGRAKLRVIYKDSEGIIEYERTFNCVHSVTTITTEEFGDPNINEKILENLRMVRDQSSLSCDSRMFGARSYAEGLSEMFKYSDPSEVFQAIIDTDLQTIGTDYPLNSEIAKFIAKHEPYYEDQYLDYLGKTLIGDDGEILCNQIIVSLEKFYGENVERMKKSLVQVGCAKNFNDIIFQELIDPNVKQLSYRIKDIIGYKEFEKNYIEYLDKNMRDQERNPMCAPIISSLEKFYDANKTIPAMIDLGCIDGAKKNIFNALLGKRIDYTVHNGIKSIKEFDEEFENEFIDFITKNFQENFSIRGNKLCNKTLNGIELFTNHKSIETERVINILPEDLKKSCNSFLSGIWKNIRNAEKSCEFDKLNEKLTPDKKIMILLEEPYFEGEDEDFREEYTLSYLEGDHILDIMETFSAINNVRIFLNGMTKGCKDLRENEHWT